MLKFFQAVLILSGMIIGVGMFGIPYSFARSGFWIGSLQLFLLTCVVLVYHLVYAKIVLATPTYHRLPGYVRLYLGEYWATLEWLSSFFGILGSLLAYLILGSLFLHAILSALIVGIPAWVSVALVFFMGAMVNALPLRKEASLNGILTAVLIGFIIVLVGLLLPHVDMENMMSRGSVSWDNLFLPYGILLFALSGGVVIPDLVTFLGKRDRRVYAAIIIGTLLPAILYFLFAFAVVGSLGTQVSEEAISGMIGIVGPKVALLGNVIGFLATLTSLIALAESFEAMLRLDLKLSRVIAQCTVSIAPLLLYIAGFQNFFVTISIVGAVAIGIDSAFVVAAHHTLEKKTKKHLSFFSYGWKGGIYFLILCGVLYEIAKFFNILFFA